MAETKGNSKVYEAIELARKTGKIRKGTNEVTKAIERGITKIVFVAQDVNPPEVVMHLEPLCKDRNVPFMKAPSREELGAAAGLSVPTVCVAIIEEGESKDLIKELLKK